MEFRKGLALVLALGFTFGLSTPSSSAPAIGDPGYDLINLSSARALNLEGAGQVVAVITDQGGFDIKHPFIADNVIDEYCAIEPGLIRMDKTYACPNGEALMEGKGASQIVKDSLGNLRSWGGGTEMAGVVAGVVPSTGEQTRLKPMASMMPKAKIVTIRVNGGAVQMAAAIDWLLAKKTKYNISAIASNFKMSYLNSRASHLDCSSAAPGLESGGLASRIKRLRESGIAFFSSTGESANPYLVDYPSCLPGAIAIQAVDNSGNVADQSNGGERVDLLAPHQVVTSSGSGDYVSDSFKASKAVAVAAGSYALIKSLRPDLTIDEVIEALKLTGTPIDDVLRKRIPQIDLDAALGYFGYNTNYSETEASSQPRIKSYSAVGIDRGLLSWVSPPGVSAKDVKYDVQVSRDLGKTWQNLTAVNSNLRVVSVSNMKTSAKYYFRARVAAATPSIWSQLFVTGHKYAEVPGVIRNLQVIDQTKSSIELVWSGPASLIRGIGTTYRLEYRAKGEASWEDTSGSLSAANNKILTGLRSGTTYEVRITSIHEKLVGKTSATYTLRTKD